MPQKTFSQAFKSFSHINVDPSWVAGAGGELTKDRNTFHLSPAPDDGIENRLGQY